MIYDVKRHALIETMAFSELPDGETTWSQLVPDAVIVPSPSLKGPATYDPSRGVFLMVSPNAGMETWEYTIATQTWTNRTPPPPLPPADDMALWWNPTTQNNGLLTGNNVATTPSVSVWTWDAVHGTWSAVDPSTADKPVGVYSIQGSTFDASSGRLVTWVHHLTDGGSDTSLWSWDTSARRWSRLSPDPWTALWPPVSGQQAAVYDPVHKHSLFVTTGFNQPVQIFDWDGVSPTFVEHPAAKGAVWPPAMDAVTGAYDRHRRRFVMCGAPSSSSPSSFWEWDGETQRWTDLNPPTRPASGPYCGTGATMAYDSARKRILIWNPDVLWQLDPTVGTWERVTVPAEVSALFDGGQPSVLVYDERRARAVIASSQPAIAEWDGSQWSVAPNPGTGDAHALMGTYDPRQERSVFVVLSMPRQMFTWNGTQRVDVPVTFGKASDSESMPGSAGIVYDLVRGNLLLTGLSFETPIHIGDSGMSVWEGAIAP